MLPKCLATVIIALVCVASTLAVATASWTATPTWTLSNRTESNSGAAYVDEHAVDAFVGDGGTSGNESDEAWYDESDYSVQISAPGGCWGEQTHTVKRRLTVSGTTSGGGSVSVAVKSQVIEFLHYPQIILGTIGSGEIDVTHTMGWIGAAGGNTCGWTSTATPNALLEDSDTNATIIEIFSKIDPDGPFAWSTYDEENGESWLRCEAFVGNSGEGTNRADGWIDGNFSTIVVVAEP